MISRRSDGLRWRPVLGYVIAGLVVASVARFLGVNWHEFSASLLSIEPALLVGSLACLLVVLGLNAIAFSRLMAAFHPGLTGQVFASAWLVAMLAKYLPIGVGHAVGRGVILSDHGVSARTTAIAAVVEQLFSVLACGLVAITAYAGGNGNSHRALLALGGLALLAALWALYPRARNHGERTAQFLRAFTLYTLAMIPYAIAYVIVLRPDHLFRFVYELFVATIAGVAAILVPGGLGVRESVAASFAGPDSAAGVLAGMTAVRCLILLSEVLGTLVGRAWLKRCEVQ